MRVLVVGALVGIGGGYRGRHPRGAGVPPPYHLISTIIRFWCFIFLINHDDSSSCVVFHIF